MKLRFVLVLLLTMVAGLMVPRQSRAAIGVGSCGWCGNKCESTAMEKVCLDVAPPEGMICTSQNGTCVATEATATGTCTPRPGCLDAPTPCLMPELTSYCPKATPTVAPTTIPTPVACLPRPACLDVVPKCSVAERESYCPGFSTSATTCNLSTKFNDDFAGASLDTNKWMSITGSGRTVTQIGGRLNLSVAKSASANERLTGVKSVQKYRGDFEVSVDVDTVAFESGQWANVDLAIDDESKYYATRLIIDANGSYVDTYSADNGVVKVDSDGYKLSAPKAKLYLLRRGNKFTSFVEIDGKKILVGSNTLTFNNPISIQVVLWRDSATSGATGSIDNLEMRCVGDQLVEPTVTLPPTFACSSNSVINDDFSGSSVDDKNWGLWTQQAPNASIGVTQGMLGEYLVKSTVGTGIDVDSKRYVSGDFSAEIVSKGVSANLVGGQAFLQFGDNHVSFSIARSTEGNLFYTNVVNVPDSNNYQTETVNLNLPASAPVKFKLERVGGTVSMYYDLMSGQGYQLARSFNNFPKVNGRVLVGIQNWGPDFPQMSGLFDDFKLTTCRVAGDADGIDWATLVDFAIWKSEYLKSVDTKKADFDNDGEVTLVDFSIWKTAYLTGQGSTTPKVEIANFADVPSSYWAADAIKILKAKGISNGCGADNYCPDAKITRAELMVMLLKTKYGSSFVPPVATSTFTDVSASYWAKDWVEKAKVDGITAGCGSGTFCPDKVVSRAEAAVLLLRAKNGASYSPATLQSTFADVPADYWASKWIEQLAKDGVTSGCGAGNFCPDKAVSRAETAVFLVKNFGLTLN